MEGWFEVVVATVAVTTSIVVLGFMSTSNSTKTTTMDHAVVFSGEDPTTVFRMVEVYRIRYVIVAVGKDERSEVSDDHLIRTVSNKTAYGYPYGDAILQKTEHPTNVDSTRIQVGWLEQVRGTVFATHYDL